MKSDPRFPPGRYEHGQRVVPQPLYKTDREPPARPQPRCVVCQTQLVEIRLPEGDHYWRCGDFPHCRFSISDAVVQEAVRRQIKRLRELNTAAAQ